METNKSLGFIGGGRITRIFLQAFKNKKVNFNSILVYDTNKEVLESLKKQFPGIKIVNEAITPALQDIVFIALHPPVIMETLELIKDSITDKSVVVSLAPKISFEKLLGKLKTNNIARMIPNATSFINEGYNPVCWAKGFSSSEKSIVLEILNILGNTFDVEESKLESYAIISAMLPTYFWFQWQEMHQIGAKMGLTEQESKDAVRDTLIAAIHTFYDAGLTQEQVIDLIPVKPISEHESAIKEFLNNKLLPLFEKIRP